MIVKVIFLGLCVCILNIILRQSQSIFIVVINIFFVVAVAIVLSDYIGNSLSNFKELLKISPTSGKMLMCLYKGALICILTNISSDICKDSGNVVVGDIIDISGRVMLLILAFPFIESVIKAANAFLLITV